MNRKRIVASCLIAVLLGGCAHEGEELPEIVQVKRVTPYHRVLDGDTVGSIAQKYGMTRAELIKLNKLEPPYQLYDGQKLVVSPKTEMPEYHSSDPDITVKNNDDGTVVQETSEAEQTSNEVIIEGESSPTIEDVQQHADNVEVIESDYIWPVANAKGKISQHFEDGEGGIIIESSAGTPVKSVADGVVMIAGIPNGDAAAYGVTVVVKHNAKKAMSIYANLKETNVKVKQKVKKGTIIGKVGKSGTIAKKPQLYFEINDLSGNGRRSVDPEKILPN